MASVADAVNARGSSDDASGAASRIYFPASLRSRWVWFPPVNTTMKALTPQPSASQVCGIAEVSLTVESRHESPRNAFAEGTCHVTPAHAIRKRIVTKGCRGRIQNSVCMGGDQRAWCHSIFRASTCLGIRPAKLFMINRSSASSTRRRDTPNAISIQAESALGQTPRPQPRCVNGRQLRC